MGKEKAPPDNPAGLVGKTGKKLLYGDEALKLFIILGLDDFLGG